MDDEDLLDLDAPSDIQSIAIQDGNGHPDSFPALSIPKHLQLPPEKNRDERLSDFLLPYEVESVVEMDEKLEIIIKHLIQCAKGRDFQLSVQLSHQSHCDINQELISTSRSSQRLFLLEWLTRGLVGLEIPYETTRQIASGGLLLRSFL